MIGALSKFEQVQQLDSRADVVLAEEVSQFYDDPLGFVMFAFDWGEGELEGFDGPDQWQIDILIDIGEAVKDRGFNGVDPVDPIKFATSSGHGIGKSALTAWLILWVMSTRPRSRGVVTANTVDQLKTKTWAELGKWHKRCITAHWFEVTNTSIYHIKLSDSWRVDCMTSREENSEAFAGLHCADSTPWYIFDEASAIPNTIWEVAEGGLTDGEPMMFVFGNPTRNNTKFFDCFHENKHRWNTRRIDSRTAKMTNKRLLQEWLDDYGEDSDFFRVRVKGEFPSAGEMQFLDSDLVTMGMNREPGGYIPDEPLICSVDIARGGGDDTRIGFRRGKDAITERYYRITAQDTRDSMKVVSKICMVLDRHKPDITFFDATGIGGPVADRLRQLGYNVIDIHFGAEADDKSKYANKTAEMADRLRQWLLSGGALPKDQQLHKELTSREFGHNEKDQLVMEKKKDIKKRLGFSPDWADQIYLTFAQAVPKLDHPRGQVDATQWARDNYNSDYDPLDDM